MGSPGQWWLSQLVHALLLHVYLPYGAALILVVQKGGHHTHIPGSKVEETETERWTDEEGKNKGRLRSCLILLARTQSHGIPTGKGAWEMKHSLYFRQPLARACVLSHVRFCNPRDCSPSGSSVHGIFHSKNTGVDCHFLLQTGISCVSSFGRQTTEPPGKPVVLSHFSRV